MAVSARFRIGTAALLVGPYTYSSYDTAVTTTAGKFIKVELESTSGVNSIAVSISSADDLTLIAAAKPTVTVDTPTKTATFQLPSDTLRSYTVSVTAYGSNGASDNKELNVEVAGAGGQHALALGETDQYHRTYGWLQKVNSAIRAADAAYVAGVTGVLFVDSAGNNTTGTRNMLTLPYATVTAAVADAQSGDVVFVGPGTYNEDVEWPDIAKLTIRGSGVGATVLENSNEYVIWSDVLSTNIRNMEISDMTLHSAGGIATLEIEGNANAESCIIKNCSLIDDGGDCGSVTLFTSVLLERVISDSRVLVSQADTIVCDECGAGGKWYFEYDLTGTHPSAGSPQYIRAMIRNSHFDSGFEVNGGLAAYINGCVGALAATLTKGTVDGTNFQGYISSNSTHGSVTISHDTGNVAPSAVGVLNGASILGALTASSTGAQRMTLDARNAYVGGTVTANNLVDIDIRGGTFGALAVAGNGTIDRSLHRGAINIGVGANNVTFAVPFTTSTYSVFVECAANPTTVKPQFSARATTGFTITAAGADANATFGLIHT